MIQEKIPYSKDEIVKDFFNYLIEISQAYNEKPLSNLMDINHHFTTFVDNAPFKDIDNKKVDKGYDPVAYCWVEKIPFFSSLSSIDGDVMAYLNQAVKKPNLDNDDVEQFCALSIKKSMVTASNQDFIDKSMEFMDILEHYVRGDISNSTIEFIFDAYYAYVDKRAPLERINKEKIISKLELQKTDPYDVLYGAYGTLVAVFNDFGADDLADGFKLEVYNSWSRRFEALKDELGYVEDGKSNNNNNKKHIVPVAKKITFEDVVGLETAKNTVARKLILPCRNPRLEKELGENTANLLVLYEPPGTGKTTFAKAVSTEIDAIYEEIGTIHGRYVGESEENFNSIVDRARKRMMSEEKNVVLYLDELTQSFDPEREYDRILIDKFKSVLSDKDGLTHITDEGKKLHVYFIGSTNHIGHLDSTLIRHERAIALEVPLPNENERKEIWRKKLEEKNIKHIDYGLLAKKTNSMSGADIVAIIEEDMYLAGMRLESVLGGKQLYQLSEKELNNINPNDKRIRITQELVEGALAKYKEETKQKASSSSEGMFF